ncbi:MAG: PQQ-binding-like beta-propeller repeat protein [Planctomycetota bacterium]|nr:PQQ-binding-like beta-propeller repeat protein [Planctomycetota bacterium]
MPSPNRIVRSLLCVVSLSVLAAGAARAVDEQDPLTGQLSQAWLKDLSDKSKGSIGAGANGTAIKAEWRTYGLLKRRNEAAGSDAQPLRIGVTMDTEPGAGVWPGLTIYWDNDNYATIGYLGDQHIYVRWMNNGEYKERPFYNQVPDPKKGTVSMRFTLLSNNVIASFSLDGANWRDLIDFDARPGRAGVGPLKILLGRGWTGERANKDAKPDFANDYYPDGNQRLIATTFRNFFISDRVAPLPEPLAFEKRENWQESLRDLEASGVPKNWVFLGPRPDRDFALFRRREGLPPDATDDWKTVPQDETGKPFRTTNWSRPEDDAGTLVDVAEILDPKSQVLAYARTEIDWPIGGPAVLYFDNEGMADLYLNNVKVFSDTKREGRAVKDGHLVPVEMKRGINVVKVKISQSRGPWAFHFRAERADPGHRIRVLERLLELYEYEAHEWPGKEARLEIPRLYLSMGRYQEALKAYDQALEAFKDDYRYRFEAFGGKLALLELLRDWKGVAAAGEQYLAASPRGMGSRDALRAVLTGKLLGGDAAGAEARAKAEEAQAAGDSSRIEWVWRSMAGAYATAGNWEASFAALEHLADAAGADATARSRAAFEAAFARLQVEYGRVAAGGKVEPSKLALICASAKKGLSLIPAGNSPQVQALAQEGEADLKAGKHERAVAGYWGAALLAMASASPDGANVFGLSKAYKAPADFAIDPNTKQLKDRNQAIKDLDAMRGGYTGQVKMLDRWKVIGPFENADGVGEGTAYGPETNPDLNARHPGKGGEKAWVETDPTKGAHDLGHDLKAFLGETKEGVVYAARDLEVPAETNATLYLSVRSGFYAWLDGKPVGEDTEEHFRVDGARIPLKLTAGKHRLLLKLVSPSDGGPLTMRCHVGAEPELAQYLLTRVWLAQAYCNLQQSVYWYAGTIDWMLNWCHAKISPAALQDLGEAYAFLNPLNEDVRFNGLFFPTQRMIEEMAYGETGRQNVRLIELLETWPDGSGRRGAFEWAAAERAARAAAYEGDSSRADDVLLSFTARNSGNDDLCGMALIMRGALRVDFSIAESAKPYYTRAARLVPTSHWWYRFIGQGMGVATTFRPERTLFTTDHDVQNKVENAKTQLKAANADDVERAMRNLGSVMRGDTASLIRLTDAVQNPLYVGVREYVRDILAHLNGDALGLYQKVVESAADERFRSAVGEGDPAGLEAVAAAYPYTPVAAKALNRSANLYMDRGEYAQAASALQILLRDYKGFEGVNEALTAAKMAHALLHCGQTLEARAAAERLQKNYAQAAITVGGKPVQAADFSRDLLGRIDKEGAGGAAAEAGATQHAGNQRRTGAPLNAPATQPGPVAWVRPQYPATSVDLAIAAFGDAQYPQIPSYPVVSGGKAFLTTLESTQALDLATGKLLWRNTSASSGALLRGQFSGFPISCPEVKGNRLYQRVMVEAQSALECRSAEDGRLVWSTAAIPELQKAVWLSDPVVAYGLAIGVICEPGDMNTHGVAAVEADTGRFRWKSSLVTGNSGVKSQYAYYGSSLQLGPPAVDGGVVYAATGLNSLAALNAFTGEANWISGYPKMTVPHLDWGSQGGVFENFRSRFMKVINRGPASPVVGEDVIVLAPKDATGLIGFDRRTGVIRWNNELEDARFVAGACEGSVLLVDDDVKAVEMSTGRVVWNNGLNGERLFGAPGYSGGMLYIPTTDHLQTIDARTGRTKAAADWDPRVGPLANFAVLPQGILGVNERLAALLGPPNAKRADLPLEEARGYVADGKWEQAADCFNRAAQGSDPENVLNAVSGLVMALGKLGRNDEGLASIDRILADKPAIIQAQGGWWQVEKSLLAEALRARLGQPSPPPAEIPQGVSGTLAYAWQLPGADPKIEFLQDGPKDRFLVQSGNTLSMMRVNARFDLMWQNYVGPGMRITGISGKRILMMGSQKLLMLDRDTGEQVWQRFLPTEEPRKRKAGGRRSFLRGFNFSAFGEDCVAAIAGDVLFAFNPRTGDEIWSNYRYDRRPIGLAYAGGRVIEFAGHSDKNTYLYAYEPQHGTRVKTETLERKRMENGATYYSPDGKYMVYRPQGGRLACVNLVEGKYAWQINVPKLNYNGYNNYGLKFDEEGNVVYYGDCHDGNDRGWHTMIFNAADGKPVKHLRGGQVSLNNESTLMVREDWGRTLARRDADKGDKDVWVFQYPQNSTVNQGLVSAFLSTAKDRLYLLYVRRSDSESDQFLLRTFDWASGQLLQSEFLPGTPIRLQEGWGYRSAVERRGNLLLIGTWEGLFAFSPRGDSRSDAIVELKKALSDEKLDPVQRRDGRRALSALEPVALQAFIAPTGLKVDGDLTEWAASDSLMLAGLDYYTPLANGEAWSGPDDCSARVCSAWDGRGIYLAVDVKDDRFVPPEPGVDLASGDSVSVAVNGLTNPYNGFDTRENVVCSLALVEGRTEMTVSGGGETDGVNQPDGRAVRAPDGKGVRYEIFLPWALLRRNPAYRPGDRKELRVGVAVYDRDGAEVKGAMEWGAGVTGLSLVPARLGQLSLLDISVEKIERYKDIVLRVPDAPETMKYLNLILATKRGPKAAQERVDELEKFLKQRPQTVHAFQILSTLTDLYRGAGEADPKGKAMNLARSLKCPQIVLDALTAQTMKGIGLRGEYYGARNFTDLKLERTDATLNYDWNGSPGPNVPGENISVRWTGELVPKFGEQYTLSTISDDGVRVWIDNKLVIENWTDHGPTEDSGKVDMQAGKAYAIRIEFFQGGGPSCFKLLWASKSQAKEVIPQAQMNSIPAGNALKIEKPEDGPKQIEAYRAVAKILQDSTDGLVFLRRILDGYKGDDRVRKCIGECEDYLRANPETTNALQILQILQALYAQDGDRNPMARCEAVMQACRVSRDNKRAFYSQYSPAWMDWNVIGPFQAVGERRGLDIVLDPEKNVDLNWKPKGAGEVELTWSKVSFAKDKRGQPGDGYIRLLPYFQEKLGKDFRREIERGPYFGYAYIKVNCSARRALLLYGANDAISIWVNNRRVVNERYPGGRKDSDATPVRLKDGDNEILIKVGCPYGALHYIFRLADEDGRPFDDLKFP